MVIPIVIREKERGGGCKTLCDQQARKTLGHPVEVTTRREVVNHPIRIGHVDRAPRDEIAD
jgi:hypothetical protein